MRTRVTGYEGGTDCGPAQCRCNVGRPTADCDGGSLNPEERPEPPPSSLACSQSGKHFVPETSQSLSHAGVGESVGDSLAATFRKLTQQLLAGRQLL